MPRSASEYQLRNSTGRACSLRVDDRRRMATLRSGLARCSAIDLVSADREREREFPSMKDNEDETFIVGLLPTCPLGQVSEESHVSVVLRGCRLHFSGYAACPDRRHCQVNESVSILHSNLTSVVCLADIVLDWSMTDYDERKNITAQIGRAHV